MLMMTITGPMGCFGLIFGDFLASLPEGTESITTLNGITCACSFFTGFATNQAFKLFSCRQVALFGGIMFFLSNTLLAFVNNILQMLLLCCTLGIGGGFSITAAFTSFNFYFVKRRNFVMGITQTVIGIGMMIYPILSQLLVEQFGFRGAQMIISAIALHAVLGAVIMQPVENHIQSAPTLSVSYSDLHLKNRHSHDNVLKMYNTRPEIRIELLMQDESSEMVNQEETISEEQNISGLPTDITISPKGSSTDISNINLYQEDSKCNIEQTSGDFLHQNEINSTSALSISNELLKSKSINEEETVKGSVDNCTPNGEIIEETRPLLMLEEKSEGLSPVLMGLDDVRRPSSQVSSVSVYFSMPRTSITTLESTEQGTARDNHYTEVVEIRTNKLQNRHWRHAVMEFFDLGLLKDSSYINTILGLALVFYSDITFNVLLPIILVSMGFSNSEAAICMSIGGATDLLGRMTYAIFGLCLNFKNRTIFLFATICMFLIRILFVQFNTYIVLATLNGVIGFFRSFINVCLPMVVAESCTMNRFPAAYGHYGIVVGVINLLAGPLIGLIKEITGSYSICIHTLSAIMLVCIVPWLLELIVHRRQMQRLQSETDKKIYDNNLKEYTT